MYSKPEGLLFSEEGLKDAIEAIKSGAVTYEEASKLFNVPPRILYSRYNQQSKIGQFKPGKYYLRKKISSAG